MIFTTKGTKNTKGVKSFTKVFVLLVLFVVKNKPRPILGHFSYSS